MMDRKQTDPDEAGLANQVAGDDASLGEAWTQAKSTKPVPHGQPSQFAEFEDEMPNSRAKPEAKDEEVAPEHAEFPSTARGDRSHR
jgi:hypothetical protein